MTPLRRIRRLSAAAVRAQPEQVELVLGDLVTLFFRHRPGRLAERPLQFRGGVYVLHLPAGRTDEVVMVTGELLGELEATVVVGAGNPAHDADVDESGHVPIGTALGKLRCRSDDLRNRERPAGRRQCLHEHPSQVRVTLVHLGQPVACGLVDSARYHHCVRH